MSRTKASRRPVVAGLAGLAVALSGLAVVSSAAPAAAVSPDLVISQVYGGGGNSGAPLTHDFIELYNRGDQPVSLAGKSLQYASATGSGNLGANSSQVTELSGTLEPGEHFLVEEAPGSGGTAPLPSPDLVDPSPINLSATAGKVALVSGTTGLGCNGGSAPCTPEQLARIVDLVGFGSANFFEGSAPAPAASNTTAVLRLGAGEQDTDDNAADFRSGTPDPRNTDDGGEELTATDPADVTANAGAATTPFTLEATGGTPPYLWSFTGLPAGITGSAAGELSGTPTEQGSFPVTATVTDSAPAPATDQVEFTITVNPALEPTPIAEIQGTGEDSGMVGDTVVAEGVVTAMYPSGGFNGMYIQTAGSGGGADATPGASDAIFVFGNSSMPEGVEVGDSVEVTGAVSEFPATGASLTEITPGAGGVEEVESLGAVTPQDVIPGTDCAPPGNECLTGAALNAAKEAHEGELFLPTGDYTVTDPYDGSAYNGGGFSSSFFGEIGLAGESEQPLVTPTEVEDAQSGDVAGRTAYNNAHRVILDDGSSLNYSSSANTDEPFPWFTPDHTVRVGASVTFQEPLVLDYRFGWKLQPSGGQVVGEPTGRITFEQDRPAQPEDVGGDLKLAAFNVLNYFTTLGANFPGCQPFNDREGNPITVRTCGDGVLGPRGAWNQENFLRQQSKIVDSINAMDADIVSLEEAENSLVIDGHDRDEAVSALVDALNADAGGSRWAFVESPAQVPADEDAIRTAFIYNPGTVELVGQAQILDHAAFANARDPFAQTFKAAGGDDADGFAVIANHFKSKGSGVNDGTGQGNANPDRVAQAEALVAFADEFAAANEVAKVFLAGDFNAYSMEDPVQVITEAGYTGLESTSDPHEESYNFDGQIGSLDHIFANEAAAPDVSGVDIWTTNAYESVYYEYSRFNYNVTNLYSDGPYRASDHNPELVGIDVDDRATPTIIAEHTPRQVKAGKTEAKLRVQVTAPEIVPTGLVRVMVPGHAPEAVQLDQHGRATVRLPVFDSPGQHMIGIAYEGDESVQDATVEYTVEVVG